MSSRLRGYVFVALVVLVAALAPSPAFAEDNKSLVASGFSSPRGIAFLNGQLLVAESGWRGAPEFAMERSPQKRYASATPDGSLGSTPPPAPARR